MSPVAFARDPLMVGVVVEARGFCAMPRPPTSSNAPLERRRMQEPVGNQAQLCSGEDGLLKLHDVPAVTPKVVGSYEFSCATVEDAGPELTRDDNAGHRGGAGGAAADPASC